MRRWDPCTIDDVCRGGECRPGADKVCPDTACQTGACDSDSGACGLVDIEDGTPCAFPGAGGVCRNGSCVACRTASDCGDTGNPCTFYGCDGAQCAESRLDDGVECETDRGDGVCCAGTCAVGDVYCDDGQCGAAVAPRCAGGQCVECVAANDCPEPGPCQTRACSGNTCRPDPVENHTNPDNVCLGNSFCCQGACAACCDGDVSTCPAPPNPDCQERTCNAAGNCGVAAKQNGTACSDNDHCTTGDSCQNGVCVAGAGVDCRALDDSCNDGICRAADGQCVKVAKSNGTACEDGNPCTIGDICQSGQCTAGATSICPDARCKKGVCDPATGACRFDNVADGSACDSDDLCSFNDVCDAGVCISGPPRQCPQPGNQCMRAVCNPETGDCDAEPWPPGKPCEDGNACTFDTICQDGVCTPGSTTTCPGTPCHRGVCDPPSGLCRLEVEPDGTVCPLGAESGVCLDGACVGCRTASDCPIGAGQCLSPPCIAACCDGRCCDVGEVCAPPNGVPDGPVTCCAPEPLGVLCQGRCGHEVVNRCGQRFTCACDVVECQDAICTPQNTCQYFLSPDNQPGPGCNGVCCEGVCCGAGEVCTRLADVPNNAQVCCVQEPRAVTCAGGKCGFVLNNCLEPVSCLCEQTECEALTCDTAAQICRVASRAPDQSACTTAGGESGICCGGACCEGDTCCGGACCQEGGICCNGQCLVGVCCADAECAPSGNDCVGNQCMCGAGDPCQAPNRGCCGPNNTCTNIDTDFTNCGACGALCPFEECRFPTCVGGECVQQVIDEGIGPECNFPGVRCCAGDCKNLQTDRANCGSCGHACRATLVFCKEEFCAGGQCVERNVADNTPSIFCPQGSTCCGGQCKNISATFTNCGFCGHVCSADTADRCVNGTCTCGSEPGRTCAPGQRCCGGVCKNAQTDLNNCGACGNTCAAGQICQGGVCGHTCENGFCPDSACFLRKWGAAGTGTSQFASPLGVAVAANGDVYVADTSNHRIQVFSATGVFKRQWGSQGSGDGQFSLPRGIAVSLTPNPTVYVTDNQNQRVQMFTPEGTFVSKFGLPFRDDQLFDGVFASPWGVAVAPNGNVYVADSGLSRVQYFSASGEFRGKFSLDSRPKGIAVAPDGNVIVAQDTRTSGDNDGVDVFTADGTFVRSLIFTDIDEQHFLTVDGVAVGSDGTVFVANRDRQRIQYGTVDGLFLGEWGGHGSDDGEFLTPTGVAVAPNGAVYVVERDNNRVQAFCVRPRS